MDKITPDQISNWVNHPVTQFLVSKLEEINKADTNYISATVLEQSAYALEEEMPKLAQMKGQVHAIARLLPIRDFLLVELENTEFEELDKEFSQDGLENL